MALNQCNSVGAGHYYVDHFGGSVRNGSITSMGMAKQRDTVQ